MMRVGVVGGRDCDNYDFVKEKVLDVISELDVELDEVVIVSGGARGVDSLAQRFAKEFGLTIIIHYPNYNKFGRRAPLVRNEKIVDDVDVLIAFPCEGSRGTWYTVNLAKKRGLKVFIFEC